MGCNRVNYDDVNRARAHEIFRDFKSLLAVVWLRHPQIVDVNAKILCVHRVKRVLCIDECRDSAHFLRFGYGMQRERCLTRTFRTVHFDDSAARVAAHAQRLVKQN